MDSITQQSQQSSAPTNGMSAEHKKVGPIIAILIVVLVLIIGALYLFASRINQQQTPVDANVTNTNSGTENSLATQTAEPITNNADDVNSLQADLNISTKGLGNQNF